MSPRHPVVNASELHSWPNSRATPPIVFPVQLMATQFSSRFTKTREVILDISVTYIPRPSHQEALPPDFDGHSPLFQATLSLASVIDRLLLVYLSLCLFSAGQPE